MRKPALLLLCLVSCLVFCCCKSRQTVGPRTDGGTTAAAGSVPRPSGKILGNDNPPSLFPVRIDGKFGYIDKKGKLVLKAEFGGASRFSQGLAAVQLRKGDRVGYIDETGTLVIPTQFELADPFSEGCAAVMKGRKWGYIDRTGQIVIPITFAAAELFTEGAAAVAQIQPTSVTTFMYINRNGEPLLDKQFQFETAYPFGEGLAPVRSLGQYFRYIDPSGKTVIPPQKPPYMSAGVFSEGLAPVNMHASEGMRWGFVGKDGKLAIRAHFVNALSFSDGLAAVQMIDGKWGYINPKGSMVITPKFDSALPFFNGMAEVQTGSTYGYIDPTGKYVWGPK
jgi:hypothetical protein